MTFFRVIKFVKPFLKHGINGIKLHFYFILFSPVSGPLMLITHKTHLGVHNITPKMYIIRVTIMFATIILY